MEIIVTNQPPEIDVNVPIPLMELFQKYTLKKYGEEFPPFTHQAEVFRQVYEDREVFLVAGTAAGKTLAVAVPLFQKLQNGGIRKVLLMYPTIALMNDQRQVMDGLGEITGVTIGQLQGGMSHSQLIDNLNRQIILATPDAIYWFFQKNVKYTGMLLYGLALIDEWVFDEAHLFNGLMLQNLRHLKERITHLAQIIERQPRWHILTATPTQELRALTHGNRIDGASKCGNIQVNFLSPPLEYDERDMLLRQAVEESLTTGKRKILVVLNSANGAHHLYNQVKDGSPTLTPEQWLHVGHLTWRELSAWFQENRLNAAVVALEAWMEREISFTIAELPENETVPLPTDKLMSTLTRFLESNIRQIAGLGYEAQRQNQPVVDFISTRLNNFGRAHKLVWQAVIERIDDRDSAAEVKDKLYRWIEGVSDQLDNQWGTNLEDCPPDFRQLQSDLRGTQLGFDLSQFASRYLAEQTFIKPEDVEGAKPRGGDFEERRVYFRWLSWNWIISDTNLRTEIQEKLKFAIAMGQLQPKSNYIAIWQDRGIPTILYSGKMSKHNRDGLVELFGKLEEAILISTPAVEVGVDFDADTLITEECDGNGFLQRFGRVGRSGGVGQVSVLLRNQRCIPRLREQLPEMPRDEFSRFIVNPDEPANPDISLFPARVYVPNSPLVSAIHHQINDQIGVIGENLNSKMFSADTNVSQLADAMKNADVPFRYGLRGTLPEITFYGEVGSDPFYVLSRIQNEKLWPPNSPFEAAIAKVGYNQFIYRRNNWDIIVDWERTCESSAFLFYWLEGQWHIASGAGIVGDLIELMAPSYRQHTELIRNQWQEHPEQTKVELQKRSAIPPFDLFARLGKAVLLDGKLLLGQGPVFLWRKGKDGTGTPDRVETAMGEPIILPDQMWLAMRCNKDDARIQLQELGLYDLEELHVDDKGEYIVLIERLVGACLYAYGRLANVG